MGKNNEINCMLIRANIILLSKPLKMSVFRVILLELELLFGGLNSPYILTCSITENVNM